MSWWARLDSNQGPIGYEPTALPLSYEPDDKFYPTPPHPAIQTRKWYPSHRPTSHCPIDLYAMQLKVSSSL